MQILCCCKKNTINYTLMIPTWNWRQSSLNGTKLHFRYIVKLRLSQRRKTGGGCCDVTPVKMQIPLQRLVWWILPFYAQEKIILQLQKVWEYLADFYWVITTKTGAISHQLVGVLGQRTDIALKYSGGKYLLMLMMS
jgi:hypothetical protein